MFLLEINTQITVNLNVSFKEILSNRIYELEQLCTNMANEWNIIIFLINFIILIEV